MPGSKKPRKNTKPATLAAVLAEGYASEARSIEARLKEPIVLEARFNPAKGGLTGFGTIKRELTDEEADWQYLEKGMGKLHLALEHFKIDPNDPHAWLLLSWVLASRLGWLNRASKPSKKAGRPPEWSLEDFIALKRDIETISTERQCGVQDACRILSNRIQRRKITRPAWMNGKKAKDLKATSLANRCSQAKKQVDNLFQLARLGFTEL
jgi:hypothetical protein